MQFATFKIFVYKSLKNSLFPKYTSINLKSETSITGNINFYFLMIFDTIVEYISKISKSNYQYKINLNNAQESISLVYERLSKFSINSIKNKGFLLFTSFCFCFCIFLLFCGVVLRLFTKLSKLFLLCIIFLQTQTTENFCSSLRDFRKSILGSEILKFP